MKQDLDDNQTENTKQSVLKDIADRYRVSMVEAPTWLKYDNAVALWRSGVSKLVTCLCMGGRHYANELSALPVREGAEPISKALADGSEVKVLPVEHKHSQARRDELARMADAARIALAEATGIQASNWPVLAEHVMSNRKYLTYLVVQGLLPDAPRRPVA